MSTKPQDLEALVAQKYRHGFVTDIESDTVAPGLDEDVMALPGHFLHPHRQQTDAIFVRFHFLGHANNHISPRKKSNPKCRTINPRDRISSRHRAPYRHIETRMV